MQVGGESHHHAAHGSPPFDKGGKMRWRAMRTLMRMQMKNPCPFVMEQGFMNLAQLRNAIDAAAPGLPG